MESNGEWLYIVFLIIAGVSSLFNAIKKKKSADTPEEEPMQPMPEQPTVRRHKRDRVSRQSTAQRESRAQAKISSTTGEPAPFLTAEQERSEPMRQAPIQSEEIEETARINPFADREELRKAILYTEILQRKV